MSTITLPNIRVSSDLTVSVRLKDNGVAIDWSTLNNVKASIYSDAQRALAGRCDVSVDAEDPTVLVCQYAANKPQYVGVCRIVVSAKYMGETKTYDKPAFNFVRWTADQDGEQITIDDPDVDVEIDVADVSSSLLDEAIRAAFTAAEEAVDAKGQVLETEAEVEAAEALRVSAEESRVEAEEGRAEAEAARVDEEAVRVSAEDARVVAENARAAAEDLREGAEDDRAAAETARETAEAARVAAEALRVTAEGSRETAEAAREAQASADHTVAAGDHTQAAADHTQAAADHTTAASDHTQAGADHTLAAADHVTAGEDHAQAQDDHEVMEGYDTRLGSVESEVSQLEAEITQLGQDMDILESTVEDIEDVTVVDAEVPTETPITLTWASGYITANGTVYPGNYKHCSIISLEEGDIIRLFRGDGEIHSIDNVRFLTAYLNGIVQLDKGSNNVTPLPYEVPSGVDEVVFSIADSYFSYGDPTGKINRIVIQKKNILENRVVALEERITEKNSSRWRGSLSDGEIVKLIQQNVKNNVLVAFSGQISAFNKIRIGVIHGTTKTPYIEIDNTNVRVYIGENYQTYPHGLTIANNIQVLLDVDFYIDQTYGALCLRRIILCSNGVFAAEMNNKNWTGDNNQYFVESVGSSLGNCSFGWSCKALESKVWIFGDSWVSMYPQRWVFQAVKKGLMSKTLVNGYAGQGSQDALVSLKNLLEIGCPQYIVWCLGMNNPDSGAINTVWKSAVDEVLSICDARGIVPILYKVPNVPVWNGNPAIDNTYKNAYIDSLGVRYIDAPAALGDNGDGMWYTGFEQSATDHVHTSELGASALFMQVIADFPEIELY